MLISDSYLIKIAFLKRSNIKKNLKLAKNVLLGLLLTICMVEIYGQGTAHKIIEPEMIFLEGGVFMMGCSASEHGVDCKEHERPLHKVTISSFNIGKYEVTQQQWNSIMGNNPSLSKKGDNYPVDNVSWDDAQKFTSLLNKNTGKNYRLPTEAEWEYAAQGGVKSKGYKYSGSNNLNDIALYDENSGNSIHSVGTKQSNEAGIYDMSGNVWEWCNDWYSEYPSSPQHDPKGATTGSYRILRGGCFFSEKRQCTITFRSYSHPGNRWKAHGIRLVLTIVSDDKVK